MELSRKAIGKAQHEHLSQMIPLRFPKLRSGQHRYIQNRLSQIARRYKCNRLPMWVSDKPMPISNEVLDHTFKVGNTAVYVQVQVD